MPSSPQSPWARTLDNASFPSAGDSSESKTWFQGLPRTQRLLWNSSHAIARGPCLIRLQISSLRPTWGEGGYDQRFINTAELHDFLQTFMCVFVKQEKKFLGTLWSRKTSLKWLVLLWGFCKCQRIHRVIVTDKPSQISL